MQHLKVSFGPGGDREAHVVVGGEVLLKAELQGFGRVGGGSGDKGRVVCALQPPTKQELPMLALQLAGAAPLASVGGRARAHTWQGPR